MKKFLIIILIFIINIFSTAFALEIHSPNVVLIDADTGRVLHEENAYAHVAPASTTKIMTAILTLENAKLDDLVTASSTAINSVPSDGSTANIQVGETISVESLLKCLMVVSRKRFC